MPELQDVANTGQGVEVQLWEAVKKPSVVAQRLTPAPVMSGAKARSPGAITGGTWAGIHELC